MATLVQWSFCCCDVERSWGGIASAVHRYLDALGGFSVATNLNYKGLSISTLVQGLKERGPILRGLAEQK